MDIFFLFVFFYWAIDLSVMGRPPSHYLSLVWESQAEIYKGAVQDSMEGEWIPTDCCLRPTCRDSYLYQAMGTWSYTTSDHNRHWPLAGCTILLSLVLLPNQAVDTKYPVEQEDRWFIFFPVFFKSIFPLHIFLKFASIFFFKSNKCKAHHLSCMP